jgi:hypothetical protein
MRLSLFGIETLGEGAPTLLDILGHLYGRFLFTPSPFARRPLDIDRVPRRGPVRQAHRVLPSAPDVDADQLPAWAQGVGQGAAVRFRRGHPRSGRRTGSTRGRLRRRGRSG